MMRFDLSGKAAVVTGGASGIGLATATMLARFGCAVAINHLSDDPRGGEVVARLTSEGHRIVAAPAHVGVAGEAERMVTSAVDALGRLDLNAVAPGAVDSSWQIEWGDEVRRETIEKAVLKRRCTPEDIAEVIVFLGFGAAMVTGQTVVVDGGLTL